MRPTPRPNLLAGLTRSFAILFAIFMAPALASSSGTASLEAAPVAGLNWWDYVFYSVSITAVCFYAIVLVVLRAYDWLYLSVTGFLVLLLVASLDGVLAAALNAGPEFSGKAPLFVGAITFGTIFAGTAWRIKTPHRLDRLRTPFYAFATLSFALIPAYGFIDSMVPLYATLNTLALLAMVSTILAPLSWDHLSATQHRLALMLPITIALVGISVYGTHFLGEGFSRTVLDSVNRLFVLIFIVYSLGFGLVYVLEEIRARRDAQQRADRAAREAAESALALREAKAEFEDAQRIAHVRSRQLAEASHDIRQPIGALRSAISNLSETEPGRDTAPLKSAIDYLEELAHSYLPTPIPQSDEVSRDAEGREIVDSGLILNTVAQIHQAQAEQQGVTLTVQDGSIEVPLRPLVMVRVLSNLVANALAHARPSTVEIACTESATGCVFAVRDDGEGMSETVLANALAPGEKGTDSKGFGLGLNIIQTQSEENGWRLDFQSVEGSGTHAKISVDF